MGVSEKRVSDFLVVGAAAEIKEVYSNFLARDVNFLDAVVYADGGDVFLDESTLTVTLYYA